ncbi:MAG: 3-oxoacyl-[acyl-carrier protein] reductase [Ilumatobacteraceae bacterium]|jgi:3-oxoacyl-[acyl-carrier protein] reductase
MSASFDFAGRTVIVTGGARGIGLALCRFFAEAGAAICVADVNEAALAEITTGVLADAIPVVVDVGNALSVASCVEYAVARTGRLDVIVNNAGILRDRMVWKLSDDDWQAVLGVHLTGTFNMTRAAVPVMRQQAYGRIVNITSYTGLHGNVGQSNYAAAKAGIIGFTRATAKELAGFGITVNAISPNAETDMVASIPADRLAELRDQIPMRRFSDPAEVGPAVAFLASEQAGYITGVVLPVDGGLSI